MHCDTRQPFSGNKAPRGLLHGCGGLYPLKSGCVGAETFTLENPLILNGSHNKKKIPTVSESRDIALSAVISICGYYGIFTQMTPGACGRALSESQTTASKLHNAQETPLCHTHSTGATLPPSDSHHHPVTRPSV